MKRLMILAAMVFAALGLAGVATADTQNTIDFSSPYAVGNINTQQGWSNSGGFDANVALVSKFTAPSRDGFGGQAVAISNAETSGSLRDPTLATLLRPR